MGPRAIWLVHAVDILILGAFAVAVVLAFELPLPWNLLVASLVALTIKGLRGLLHRQDPAKASANPSRVGTRGPLEVHRH